MILDKINKIFESAMREESFTFSSLQVDITGSLEKEILDFGKSIPVEDIYQDEEIEGLEDNPHVTVKYGLHTNDVDEVKEVLKGQKSFEVTLGKLSCFESDNYDVLIIEIDSPKIHSLNKHVCDNLEHTNTFPNYTPHTTIAYLKKGIVEQYIGIDRFDNKTIEFNEICFSIKNGEKDYIKLGD